VGILVRSNPPNAIKITKENRRNNDTKIDKNRLRLNLTPRSLEKAKKGQMNTNHCFTISKKERDITGGVRGGGAPAERVEGAED